MQVEKAAKIPGLAAIRYANGFQVDPLLCQVAKTLKAEGFKLAGHLQSEHPGGENCCSIMNLQNISTGHSTQISQSLGAASRGCRLDPQALAETVGQLMNEINPDIDLLIINRFGKAETEGQGFRSVIEKCFEYGVPVLTAVRAPYLDGWKTFGGSYAIELENNQAAILNWFRSYKKCSSTKTSIPA